LHAGDLAGEKAQLEAQAVGSRWIRIPTSGRVDHDPAAPPAPGWRAVGSQPRRRGSPATWRSGAPPEVDLRPRWSRLLQTISATARRIAAAEALETLRLEADAALIRATGRLAAR